MRDQILAEIKRIAKANGGQPPGRNIFENETGVKPHEWRGKYWARWGDALNEAGFSANELQGKLDLPVVFAAMAAAVRQFKREPTIAEFEMCRQRDKNFPAYKSVVGHFESKAQMTGALRAWAENTEGYDDIVALLPAYEIQSKSISSPAPKEGYVYLIKSGTFYKIGRGDELEKRVKQIRVALPDASTLGSGLITSSR